MVELVLLDEDGEGGGGGASMSNERFTVAEVATHNSADDCWVIIHRKVYDVTKYLDDHPGGDQVLLVTAGEDATEEFDDAGHSTDAWKLIEKYLVGQVDLNPVKAEGISQLVFRALPTVASIVVVGLLAVAYLGRRRRKC